MITVGRQQKRNALGLGRKAESFVVCELENQGWFIRARNWRGGGGELDIVCSRDDELRFVEVKARRRPEAQPIRAPQIRRLRNAASGYLAEETHRFRAVYFSVALVSCGCEPWQVVWYEDAFDGIREEKCHFG